MVASKGPGHFLRPGVSQMPGMDEPYIKCPNCGSPKVICDFDQAQMVCEACGHVLDPQQVLEIEDISFTVQEVAERTLLKIRNWQAAAHAMHERIDDDLQAAIKRETDGSSVKPDRTCKYCHKPLISAGVGRGRPTDYHSKCKKKASREQSNERHKRWRNKHPNLKRGQGYACTLIARDAAASAPSNNALDTRLGEVD